MAEPKALTEARRHLARAEDALWDEAGLFHLLEGLALLESVIDEQAGSDAESVARNLGRTYAGRIHGQLEQDVGAGLSEPELEQAFAVLRAFDGTCFELPPGASALKVEVVRRLVALYSEGQAPAEKVRLFEQLAEISGHHD
jgi:hypothetical protein